MRMLLRSSCLVLVSILSSFAIAACGGDDSSTPPPGDSGTARDSGSTGRDGSTVTPDGGGGGVDSGDIEPPDDCAGATECGACTDMGTCGWCAGNNTCFTGEEAGPTSGTCPSGWDWYGDMCTYDCAAATDCSSCTDLPPCGWCAGSSTCMQGDEPGPSMGTCVSGWDFFGKMCV